MSVTQAAVHREIRRQGKEAVDRKWQRTQETSVLKKMGFCAFESKLKFRKSSEFPKGSQASLAT